MYHNCCGLFFSYHTDHRLDAVYDVTVAYRGPRPAQTEAELFSGENTPEEVCFHFRRWGELKRDGV